MSVHSTGEVKSKVNILLFLQRSNSIPYRKSIMVCSCHAPSRAADTNSASVVKTELKQSQSRVKAESESEPESIVLSDLRY